LDVTESLAEINNSIRALAKEGALSSYFPLIGMVASAIVAILATRASVWFSSKRLELNCARALRAEINGINEEIKRSVENEKIHTYAKVSFLATSDRICPVYRGAATSVGLLDTKVIEQVINFYSAVLTLKPVVLADVSVKDAFAKSELIDIAAKGKLSIDALQEKYGRKLA
jgi:hypothetical protein